MSPEKLQEITNNTINTFKIDLNTGIITINKTSLLLNVWDFETTRRMIAKSDIATKEINTDVIKFFADAYRTAIFCQIFDYEYPKIQIFLTGLPKQPNDVADWCLFLPEVNQYAIKQAEEWITNNFGNNDFPWGYITIWITYDPHYSTEDIYQCIKIGYKKD